MKNETIYFLSTRIKCPEQPNFQFSFAKKPSKFGLEQFLSISHNQDFHKKSETMFLSAKVLHK